MAELKRVLNLRDIVLMNIVAIVGLRWLLTAAQTGPSATTLWLAALLLFFIPQALSVIELTTRYPQEGGIYIWTKEAFGPGHGFIAGWCYWVTNIIYFPSLLIFIASNALFIGGTAWLGLESNPLYIVGFSLSVLWLILGLNIRGLSLGRWVQNIGALGTWFPVLLLLGAGLYAAVTRGSATTFTVTSLLPTLNTSTLGFWATMCFGFAGLELASVLGDEVQNPRKTIPRGIVIAGVMVAFIYILGTLALQVALPLSETSLLSGIPQAISRLFAGDASAVFLGALVALAITLGGMGGISAWLGGTARIPYVSGLDNYLPKALGKVHPKYGTPHVSLIWQGIFSSAFILMSVVGATVEEAYMVLIDATLVLYFIPYLYMFAAVIKLRNRDGDKAEVIQIPGGRWGLYLAVAAGLFSTAVSIIFSLIPGPEVASPALFVAKVAGGSAAFVLIGVALYRFNTRRA